MFRTLAILLLLGGCASSGGYAEPELHDCAAGGELSVDAWLNMPKIMMERSTDYLTMLVAIGNNSGRDVEIKSIRVEPGPTAQQRYALESGFLQVNQVLAAGEEEKFELQLRGSAGQREARRPADDFIEIVLTVSFADGTNYRCEYDVQAPQ